MTYRLTILTLLTLSGICCCRNDSQDKQNHITIKHGINSMLYSHDSTRLPAIKKSIPELENNLFPKPKNPHEVLSTDANFYGEHLLKGYTKKLRYYFDKYEDSSNGVRIYMDTILIKYFEGVKELGYLNRDKIKDSVFVLPELNIIEEGESYYFSDTTIPRLHTESFCCHPDNIFLVGDIDEDGISEIGLFVSACTSRYKALYVYSLKNNKWKEVGHVYFDIFYEKPKKEMRIRKTGKGKFEMLEISDCVSDKKYARKPHWVNFSF